MHREERRSHWQVSCSVFCCFLHVFMFVSFFAHFLHLLLWIVQARCMYTNADCTVGKEKKRAPHPYEHGRPRAPQGGGGPMVMVRQERGSSRSAFSSLQGGRRKANKIPITNFRGAGMPRRFVIGIGSKSLCGSTFRTRNISGNAGKSFLTSSPCRPTKKTFLVHY